MIRSVARIKKAAAITNFEVGVLDRKRTDAIVKACDEVIEGKLHDQFIVDPIQGGAGTSLNMNANEVIANREHCRKQVDNSIGIITAICPHVGYQVAADVAKEALAANRSVRELILEKGLLTEERLETILDPFVMTEPGILGR